MKLAAPAARSSLASIVLAVLWGCGRDAPPDERPDFPLRLLPEPSIASEALFDSDFTTGALDGWFTLEWRGERLHLEPAAGRVTQASDLGVRLAALPATLLRFVETPPETRMLARAVVATEATEPDAPVNPLSPGERTAALALFPIEPAEPGQDLAALLASGQARGADGAAARLEYVLAERIQSQVRTPAARLEAASATAPASPALEASIHGDPLPDAAIWVVALVAAEGPLCVRSVHAVGRAVHGMARTTIDPTAPAVPAGEVAPDLPLVLARIGGELRPGVVVRAGESVALAAEVADGARQLTFGTLLETAAPDGTSGWRVVLEQDGRRSELGAGAARFDPDAFEEHALPWPDDMTGALTIRFANDGSHDLVVAQPIVRGPPRDARANVLFIVLDTLRADRLGYHGYGRPTSPFLDALAARSTVFLDAAAVAPFTLPTHATLFTGLFPPRHGVIDFKLRLDPRKLAFLPLVLARHGYATAAFTGGGYVSEDFGFAHGFDRFASTDPMRPAAGVGWEPPDPQPRRHTLDDVAAWIEARRDERWFCFVHTYAIHNYFAPREVFEAFDSGVASRYRDTLATRPRHEFWKEEGQAPTPDDVRHLSDLYDATIRYADEELSRLFVRLEAQGALDDTIVVITSDHGEEFFEHGGLGHAITLYEEQLRVPLLVHLPGQTSGRRVPSRASQADVSPTLLDLLGLPPIAGADGQSLAGWLRDGGAAATDPTPRYAQVHTGRSRRSALQVGALKLIHGETGPVVRDPARAPWEFFDLGADPGEHADLAAAAARAAELERLQKGLEAFEQALARRAPGAADAGLSDDVDRQLRELGYVR